MMNIVSTVTSIALANRPRQLDLLASVAKILEASPAVSHILVRGSFATGRADRSSDVDLVIGVLEVGLEPFLSSLDTLVRTELGALLPGWRDSLVSDMGGRGYVYLIPAMETLYELDLYVIPQHQVPAMLERGAAIVYRRAETCRLELTACDPDPVNVRPACSEASMVRDLVVEILVLLHMMSKRVSRRQSFIVYGQTYLLNDAVRRLIKHCLAPWSKHWGWYHLEEDLSGDPAGSVCLRELGALVSAAPVRDRESLQEVFTHVERVIACAAPTVWAQLSQELEAYRHYTGLR
jgi:predicted nucleotidyltransferase